MSTHIVKEHEATTRMYPIKEENVEIVSGEMPDDGIKNDEPSWQKDTA